MLRPRPNVGGMFGLSWFRYTTYNVNAQMSREKCEMAAPSLGAIAYCFSAVEHDMLGFDATRGGTRDLR